MMAQTEQCGSRAEFFITETQSDELLPEIGVPVSKLFISRSNCNQFLLMCQKYGRGAHSCVPRHQHDMQRRSQLPDLPQTFDLSYTKSLTRTRRSLHEGSKVQHHSSNRERSSKHGEVPSSTSQTVKLPLQHLSERTICFFFSVWSVRETNSCLCVDPHVHGVAFVSVRIKPSRSHCESHWQCMWPEGDLCFYCVYTSWKCADGDADYSEDERRSARQSRSYIHTWLYTFTHCTHRPTCEHIQCVQGDISAVMTTPISLILGWAFKITSSQSEQSPRC